MWPCVQSLITLVEEACPQAGEGGWVRARLGPAGAVVVGGRRRLASAHS